MFAPATRHGAVDDKALLPGSLERLHRAVDHVVQECTVDMSPCLIAPQAISPAAHLTTGGCGLSGILWSLLDFGGGEGAGFVRSEFGP
jgi:hypothetical protein